MSTNYQKKVLQGIRYAHYFTGSLVILFLLASIVNQFIVTFFQVDGHSMDPTLHNGEVLVVNKLGYDLGAPRKNDIVILYYSGDSSVHYVKRIVGVPNQVVMLEGREWKLGSNQYFVAGDNRLHSTDSRAYGPITRSQIIGKVVLMPNTGALPLNDQ
jgi:signal peptidase I